MAVLLVLLGHLLRRNGRPIAVHISLELIGGQNPLRNVSGVHPEPRIEQRIERLRVFSAGQAQDAQLAQNLPLRGHLGRVVTRRFDGQEVFELGARDSVCAGRLDGEGASHAGQQLSGLRGLTVVQEQLGLQPLRHRGVRSAFDPAPGQRHVVVLVSGQRQLGRRFHVFNPGGFDGFQPRPANVGFQSRPAASFWFVCLRLQPVLAAPGNHEGGEHALCARIHSQRPEDIRAFRQDLPGGADQRRPRGRITG